MGDERIDLANPDFEPTDAQLRDLATRAFSSLSAVRERRLARLRDAIACERARVLRALTDPSEPR